MKRKVTLRSTLLIAAPLCLAALPALAQDAPGTIISIIGGLAPDDLLNIRATASPGGKIEARLPNGAAVKNYGCKTVNNNPWCKVEDTQDARITGWAPARYLSPNNPASPPEDSAAPAAAAAAPQPPPPEEPQADMAARLGGEPADPPSATEIVRTAMLDAYGLAFVTSASTESDAPAPDAAGGIPCARHIGQPMTRCAVTVARKDGDSDVTVTWPDGGVRIITFHGGQPSSSDSSEKFRFTREGTLNMIRIGVSERFEITDELALGE